MDKAIWQGSSPEQKAVLITLLMLANHNEKEWLWQGNKFKAKPGQFITSINSIAKRAGVSKQNVRSALVKFEKLEFLTNQSTKTGRLITIINWGLYQGGNEGDNKATNKEVTKHQQRGNKALTPNKNNKNDKNKNIGDFFENIWSLYPNKKGKGKISDKQKERLYKLGFDTLKTCIDRYKKSKEDWQKWQYGSTFFNSGYVDYLDENYQEQKEPSPYRPAAEIMEERRRRNAL